MMRTILFVCFIFALNGGDAIAVKDGVRGRHDMQDEEQRKDDRNLQSTTNPAFVTVIDSYTDTTELCYSFQTLIRATGYPDAPVIAFTGITLPASEESVLQACSNRFVEFVDIKSSYNTFPDSFTPVPGVNYDYQQTQRFLTTGLWEHEAIEEYDVIVIISDSSCITFENSEMPGLGDPEIMYQSQSFPGVFEIARKYSFGLYDITFDYISNNKMFPKNQYLWSTVVRSQHSFNALPMFNSDFEIVRKSFMQRFDVRAFHYDLSENHSEFFERKWSSNTLRYLTMSIFARYENVATHQLPGIVLKDILNGNLFPNICRIVE
jgi:hypothetical protein